MAEQSTTVAVLGTGTMGAPMARNLLRAGFDVRVWNRTRERAQPLEQDGATVADSPAQAAAQADFVLTMLPDADAVASVMQGDRGALGAMPDDAVWLQMSTVGLAGTERLSALASERNVAFVDAPVVGTKEPAEQGQLLILASGPEDQRERCAPIFQVLGSRTMWLGPAGAGTRLKLVINDWLTILVEGLAETIAFAEALGVAPHQFLEAIEGGPLSPPYAQLKGRAMIEHQFSPSFKLRLARKDVGLVLEAAARHDLELPIAEAVARQFDRAIELGHGEEDLAATYYASAPAA
jgi:3-hydroxyisobutyrate dehydrogenase